MSIRITVYDSGYIVNQEGITVIFQYVKADKRFLTMIFGLILLFSVSLIVPAAASDQKAVWVSGDSLQGFFSGSDSKEAPSKEACQVRRTFYDFCSNWIGSKNNYSIKNVQIKTTGNSCVKEYSQCGDAYELRITKAPGSSVYVGTLKYVEKIFQADANASGKDKPENFAVAREFPVTEFFMFKDGKWLY